MYDSPLLDLVVYQIYPRSFQDSNSDGVGDIPGIIQRLDYLVDLGVNAIWLTPVYPSPMVDFGYDITDHCAIDPVFGTMEDMDNLITECHNRDIKVIMEFIPNHTSDQHPWFLESRSSRDNPKRDWYIWHDPKPDGSPPNNWLSIFSGSAWEYDERTDQYYMHNFATEQPDLNWYNPKVKQAMYDVLQLWIDKGVDGFRVDAIIHIFEDLSFENEPENPDAQKEKDPYKQLDHIHTRIQPAMLPFIRELSRFLCKKNKKLIVSEAYETPREVIAEMYKQADSQLYSGFNFTFIGIPWDQEKVKYQIDSFYEQMEQSYIPSFVLGNHDVHRVASRYTEQQVRALAVTQFALRGVPYIYYGEEIGMQNVPIPADKVRDPRELQVPGKGLGRDPVRTPMQWDDSLHAGFSSQEPWLPVAENYQHNNVEKENQDKTSILLLYKKLITLRKNHQVLRYGSYEPFETGNQHIFGFKRVYQSEELFVLTNFSSSIQSLSLDTQRETILCSSSLERIKGVVEKNFFLYPYESVIT